MPVSILSVAAQLAHDRWGITAIEYALITAVISGVALTAAHSMGDALTVLMTRVVSQIT